MKYTPAGIGVREATLAVNQNALGKNSVGYHEVLLFGEIVDSSMALRIGSMVRIEGSLWVRSFLNRKSVKVTETKVIASTIKPIDTRRPRVDKTQTVQEVT